MYHIFTDGACSGNPGSGGYSIVVMDDTNTIIYYIYNEETQQTTNNREELKAIIKAIDFVKKNNNYKYIIYTDSSYCEQIINKWMYGWVNNNWKNAKGQTIKNLDLIQGLYNNYIENFANCQVEKISGHSGIIGNELADAAATKNASKIKKIFANSRIFYQPVNFFDKF